MKQTAKKKAFDCIAFKRDSQRKLAEETRGMPEDQRRVHKRKLIESGPLAEFWEKVERQAKFAAKNGRI